MVGLCKVIILVEDNRSVALIGRENKGVGVVAEGAESCFFRFREIGLLGDGGGKFRVRYVGQDMTDVALNGVHRREFGGFMLAVGLESRKAGMMDRQVGVGSWLG